MRSDSRTHMSGSCCCCCCQPQCALLPAAGSYLLQWESILSLQTRRRATQGMQTQPGMHLVSHCAPAAALVCYHDKNGLPITTAAHHDDNFSGMLHVVKPQRLIPCWPCACNHPSPGFPIIASSRKAGQPFSVAAQHRCCAAYNKVEEANFGFRALSRILRLSLALQQCDQALCMAGHTCWQGSRAVGFLPR